MNNKNKISEAELEIMKIVWERQEAVASSDIVGILKKRCGSSSAGEEGCFLLFCGSF